MCLPPASPTLVLGEAAGGLHPLEKGPGPRPPTQEIPPGRRGARTRPRSPGEGGGRTAPHPGVPAARLRSPGGARGARRGRRRRRCRGGGVSGGRGAGHRGRRRAGLGLGALLRGRRAERTPLGAAPQPSASPLSCPGPGPGPSEQPGHHARGRRRGRRGGARAHPGRRAAAGGAAAPEADPGELPVPRVALEVPAPHAAHPRLRGRGGLVSPGHRAAAGPGPRGGPGPGGGQPSPHLPRQPLLRRLPVHPAGLRVAALPPLPGRVLALPRALEPGAAHRRGHGAGADPPAAAGAALRVVEGHQLPLRAAHAPDHALPQRRRLHHHAGVPRARRQPHGARRVRLLGARRPRRVQGAGGAGGARGHAAALHQVLQLRQRRGRGLVPDAARALLRRPRGPGRLPGGPRGHAPEGRGLPRVAAGLRRPAPAALVRARLGLLAGVGRHAVVAAARGGRLRHGPRPLPGGEAVRGRLAAARRRAQRAAAVPRGHGGLHRARVAHLLQPPAGAQLLRGGGHGRRRGRLPARLPALPPVAQQHLAAPRPAQRAPPALQPQPPVAGRRRPGHAGRLPEPERGPAGPPRGGHGAPGKPPVLRGRPLLPRAHRPRRRRLPGRRAGRALTGAPLAIPDTGGGGAGDPGVKLSL